MSQETININKSQYIVEKKSRLGRGAYASVYKGFIQATNEPVAIKIMGDVKFKKNEEKYIECGKREIEIFKHVANLPNVINMIDYIDNEDGITIIMEFCEGGTLRKLLRSQKEKRFEESKAIEHFREISKGVLSLHQRNIMHKDLNLENILLKNKKCVIADLGSAVRQKRSYNYAGAAGYTAPEIRFIKEGKGYTKQVDIWALGVIFFEMLYSRAVYKDMMTQIVEEAYLGKERFPQEPKISNEARGLLDKMLTIDPTKRIAIEGVLNHPFLRREGLSEIKLEKDEEKEDKGTDSENDEITDKMIIQQNEAKKEKKKNKKKLSKKAKADQEKGHQYNDKEEDDGEDEDEEEQNINRVPPNKKEQNKNNVISNNQKNTKKTKKNKKNKGKNQSSREESMPAEIKKTINKPLLLIIPGLIMIVFLFLGIIFFKTQ